jgi:hypothetical protein
MDHHQANFKPIAIHIEDVWINTMQTLQDICYRKKCFLYTLSVSVADELFILVLNRMENGTENSNEQFNRYTEHLDTEFMV